MNHLMFVYTRNVYHRTYKNTDNEWVEPKDVEKVGDSLKDRNKLNALARLKNDKSKKMS